MEETSSYGRRILKKISKVNADTFQSLVLQRAPIESVLKNILFQISELTV